MDGEVNKNMNAFTVHESVNTAPDQNGYYWNKTSPLHIKPYTTYSFITYSPPLKIKLLLQDLHN